MKLVEVSDYIERVHWRRFIINHTPYGGSLMLHLWEYRCDIPCTDGSLLLNQKGGSPPCGNYTSIIQGIDALITRGRDVRGLQDALCAINIALEVESRTVVERRLADVTTTDSLLEERLAALERFVAEFLRLDEPAAESMRRLGARPLDAPPGSLRRFERPYLSQAASSVRLRVEWDRPLMVDGEIEIELRLRCVDKVPA